MVSKKGIDEGISFFYFQPVRGILNSDEPRGGGEAGWKCFAGKKGEMNYEKEEWFSQENLTVGSAGRFQRAGILL